MSALLDSLAEGFEGLPADRVEARGLGEARRAALRRSLVDELPTQRVESWKYTALRALGARRFVAAAQIPSWDASLLDSIPGPRLVFVDGQYDGAHSQADSPGGARLQALSTVLGMAGSALPWAPAHRPGEEVFASLNDALAIEGVELEVPASVDAGLVNLVFVSTRADADLAVHLRHRIRLGAGARLRLVEHHLAGAVHRNLVNHVAVIELGEGAQLSHARLQDEDVGASLVARTEASLAGGALYRRADLELGAALSRHDLSISLAGHGARCDAGGVLLADGRRHLDTRLSLTHAAPATTCDLRWRGLAADRGRLAFLGAITIAAGADGSEASLSAKNLLLSEGAEVDAQPVLEIHADEVKAAHGATVGRLDPTALFYLRSRGIPEAQARALLTQAFCREALGPLGPDEALLALVSPRLEARLLASEAS